MAFESRELIGNTVFVFVRAARGPRRAFNFVGTRLLAVTSWPKSAKAEREKFNRGNSGGSREKRDNPGTPNTCDNTVATFHRNLDEADCNRGLIALNKTIRLRGNLQTFAQTCRVPCRSVHNYNYLLAMWELLPPSPPPSSLVGSL